MRNGAIYTRRAVLGGCVGAIAPLAGCDGSASLLIEEVRAETRRVGMLIDMSGSYRSAREGLRDDLLAISRRLGPGDELFVQFIAACSYQDRFSPSELTWRLSPSRLGSLTDLQSIQRDVAEHFELPALPPSDTGYTDIRGALHLALERQRQSDHAIGIWFVFSDLKITLKPGCTTASQPLGDMTGITLVGVNIWRGPEDTRDRALYRQNILSFRDEIHRASGRFEESQSASAALDRVLAAPA